MNKNNIILVILLVFAFDSCPQKMPFMDYLPSWDRRSSILEVELTYSASQKDSTVFII